MYQEREIYMFDSTEGEKACGALQPPVGMKCGPATPLFTRGLHILT